MSVRLAMATFPPVGYRIGVFTPGPADVRAVFATQGPARLNTVARDQTVVLG